MSNARFDVCVERVLKHEDHTYDSGRPGSGRLVNHPADPGGATRLGITLATLRRWRGDRSLPPDALASMTHDEARAIYHARYWNAVRADSLPAGLDYAVFDYAVNSGPGRAARALQEIVGVNVDGVIGDVTIRAAADADRAGTIRRYCDRRRAFLRSLPRFDTFGNGWMRRVDEVERAALADMTARLPVAQVVNTDTGRGAAFVAGIVAVVTPIVEAVRAVAPALEGMPVWAVVAVAAASAVAVVFYWRSGRA